MCEPNRDDRGAQVEEEEPEDERHEDAPEQEGGLQVADGPLDEARGAEDGRVDADATQRGGQRGEGRLDAAGDGDGVGLGLLLHDEQEPRAVVDDGVADGRGVILGDGGDVAEAEGVAPAPDDRHLSELVGGGDDRGVGDGEALVGRVDEAAARGGDGVPRGAEDVVEADAVGAEPVGVDAHLELPVALPPDGHVGDARDGHEARAHRPTDDVRELHLREGVGADADLHHAAERREGREDDGGPGGRRELRGGAGEALLHEGAGGEEVGHGAGGGLGGDARFEAGGGDVAVGEVTRGGATSGEGGDLGEGDRGLGADAFARDGEDGVGVGDAGVAGEVEPRLDEPLGDTGDVEPGGLDAVRALPQHLDGPQEPRLHRAGADGEEDREDGVGEHPRVGEVSAGKTELGEVGLEGGAVPEGDGGGFVFREAVVDGGRWGKARGGAGPFRAGRRAGVGAELVGEPGAVVRRARAGGEGGEGGEEERAHERPRAGGVPPRTLTPAERAEGGAQALLRVSSGRRAGSSAEPSLRPFLKLEMPSPMPLPSSGIFAAPKSRTTRTAMTMSSGRPSPNMGKLRG
jgi:hypothetical protein